VLSLTAVVGPLIATTVFSYFTSPEQAIKLPGASFFLGSALTFLGLILAVRTFARYPAPVPVGQAVNLPNIGA
jgi:DHA1 family tetracycline resistance protein-like MFS transporter